MRKFVLILLTCLTFPGIACAGEITDWLSVDAYMRARALSSLNGGKSGALGNTTLLGRLMNESTKLQIDAEARPMQDFLAHIRLEGETFKGADTDFGSLAKLVLTQTYVQIDDCFTDGLSLRVGSADYLMGVMQYYDLKPGRVLLETYGIRVDYSVGDVRLTAALGDSGYIRRRDNYAPLLTGALGVSGTTASGAALSAAVEVFGELESPDGKRESTGNAAYKIVGGAKWQGDGVIRRADTYVNFTRELPTADNDRRGLHSLTVGHELQLATSERTELGFGAMLTWSFSSADFKQASTDNSIRFSPLIRMEVAPTDLLHALVETAYSVQHSYNGGIWDGADLLHIWQGKVGLILSPKGLGLLTRPHLRLLYGAQFCSDSDIDCGQKLGKQWKHAVSAEFEIKF